MTDSAYQQDGGRERLATAYRSFDQRRYDSAMSLLGFGDRPSGELGPA